jgi:hypothetical protein
MFSGTDNLRELSRLRWEYAVLRMDIAMLRLQLALEAAYDPNQPRIPAGRPDGGQ